MWTLPPVIRLRMMSRTTWSSSAARLIPRRPQSSRRLSFVHAAVGGQKQVLAVVHHGDVEDPGVFHRPAHDLAVLHRAGRRR